MGAHPKGDRTQAELADLAGVTVRTIREWTKEGVDVYDLQALMARASKVREREEQTEDLAGVKLRKLKAEADLKEHELQVERGLFVSKEEVLSEGMKIGMVIKSTFLKLSSDLAPILAGRPASEVKTALDKYAREKLTELSLYDSPIKIPAD